MAGLFIAPHEIWEYVILGQPPRGYKEGELDLVIGPHAVIRSFSVIYEGSRIGSHFQTGHGVIVREDNTIGDHVVLGSNVRLEPRNVIGDGSHVHSGSTMELTTLGKHVFIGPNVTITSDPHPMGCPSYKECKGGAHIYDYAVVGGGCVLLPGVAIHERSILAAGSVLTHDVPGGQIWAGNPAKFLMWTKDLECVYGAQEFPYDWAPYVEE